MTKTFSLFLVLLFLGVCGLQAQTIDTLINVGSHKLHFRVIPGDADKTPILFEAGNGDDASVWEGILTPIQTDTKAPIITYDRAGLGQSEIDTTTINFKQEVLDLELALQRLGFNSGIFVVSHSFGGFYSLEFANHSKNNVKGAIFIDVATPCYFTEQWSSNFKNSISEENWALIKQYKAGLYYVLQDLDGIASYMSDATFPLSIPLTLIAAENPPSMVQQNERESWTRCLQSFASDENHSYVLAPGSGHKVWEDNPDIVIREIVSLYQKAH